MNQFQTKDILSKFKSSSVHKKQKQNRINIPNTTYEYAIW